MLGYGILEGRSGRTTADNFHLYKADIAVENSAAQIMHSSTFPSDLGKLIGLYAARTNIFILAQNRKTIEGIRIETSCSMYISGFPHLSTVHHSAEAYDLN